MRSRNIEAINWNKLDDDLDLAIWNKLVSQFWVPEKIPMSNDLPSWNLMSPEEKSVVNKIFVALTLLDTVQSQVGAPSLMPDALTPHEEAVYTNIAFMESIHAKSYSTIFSTLLSTQEINELFEWAKQEPRLQYKEKRILDQYWAGLVRPEGMNDRDWSMARLKKKGASVLLESFLFYSGFYAPLKFATLKKIPNSADIIRLILRDESVHGLYIGTKARLNKDVWGLTDEDWSEFEEWVRDLTRDLLVNEDAWTEEVYDCVGWTSDVKKFVRYNANKAFMNLGIEPMFSAEECTPSTEILASLDIDQGENQDFFSSQGSTYLVGNVDTQEEQEDWDNLFEDD